MIKYLTWPFCEIDIKTKSHLLQEQFPSGCSSFRSTYKIIRFFNTRILCSKFVLFHKIESILFIKVETRYYRNGRLFLVKASQEMRNRITCITSRLYSVVQRIDGNLLTKQLHGKRWLFLSNVLILFGNKDILGLIKSLKFHSKYEDYVRRKFVKRNFCYKDKILDQCNRKKLFVFLQWMNFKTNKYEKS